MAQIVPGPRNLGQQLGSGLSAGLTALAEQKFAELARNQAHKEKASRLMGLGIPANQADYLAGMSDRYSYAAAQPYFGAQQEQPYGQPTAQAQPPQVIAPQNQPLTIEQVAQQATQIPGAQPSPEQLMLQSLAQGNPISDIQANMRAIQEPSAMQTSSAPGSNPESAAQEDMLLGQPMPQEIRDMIAQKKQTKSEKVKKSSIEKQGAPVGVKEARQSQIEQKNAPYNEEFSRRRNAVTDFMKILPRMREDILSGEIASPREAALQGVVGQAAQAVKPYNARTSSFLADAQRLALLELYMSPGQPTEGKLEAHERSKPNLSQPDEVKLERIRDIEDKAIDIQLEEEARNQLVKENSGFQPSNFEDRAKERTRELKKEYVKQKKEEYKLLFKEGAEFDGLPDARYAPADARIASEDGTLLKPVKGKWVRA